MANKLYLICPECPWTKKSSRRYLVTSGKNLLRNFAYRGKSLPAVKRGYLCFSESFDFPNLYVWLGRKSIRIAISVSVLRCSQACQVLGLILPGWISVEYIGCHIAAYFLFLEMHPPLTWGTASFAFFQYTAPVLKYLQTLRRWWSDGVPDNFSARFISSTTTPPWKKRPQGKLIGTFWIWPL